VYIDRWRIIGELGRGGTGVVYRAVSPSGAEAAVKLCLHREHSGVLRREGAFLARLDHPGVIAVLDTGEADGLPWIAMPLLRGLPLRDLLPRATEGTLWDLTDAPDSNAPKAGAAIPPARALGWLGPLARTLAWLHGEGVVHRDLKPENVFITDDGRVVLLDLGLGQAGREALGAPTGGSRGYLSPELRNGGRGDARADVWAWGAMLHEALTGRLPPVGELDPDETAVPPPLFRLLRDVLPPDPARRTVPMVEIVAALERDGWMPPDPRAPRARPPLLRAALIERDPATAAIEALLATPRADGELWFVGPAGSGRTRLLLEAGDRARRRGWNVLRLPGTGSTPRQPAGALRELDATTAEAALAAVVRRAATRPVLCLVDDLESGGALLREVVATLGLAARAGTARVAVAVAATDAPGAWTRRRVEALGPIAAPERFLWGILGSTPPPGLAATLPPWPRALTEGVRAAIAAGALTWTDGAWAWNGLVEPRTAADRVSAAGLRFARAVALARSQLPDPALEALAAPDPATRAAAVREALREELVEAGPAGWEPGSAGVPDASADAALCRDLGAALVAAGDTASGAEWLEHGGDRDAARQAYRAARLNGGPADARFARMELELTPAPAPPDLIEAAMWAANWQGDYRAVIALARQPLHGPPRRWVVRALREEARLDEAEAMARVDLDDPAERLLMKTELATLYARKGDIDAAEAALDAAERAPQLDPGERFKLLRVRGDVRLTLGRFDGVIDTYRAALALNPNPSDRASTLGNLAIALAFAGNWRGALEAAIANWSIARDHGIERSQAITLRNIAELAQQDGQPEVSAALAAGAVVRLFPLRAWPSVLSAATLVARRPGASRAALTAIFHHATRLRLPKSSAVAGFELALRCLRDGDVAAARAIADAIDAPAAMWQSEPTLRTLRAIRQLPGPVAWPEILVTSERARLASGLAIPFPERHPDLAAIAAAAWHDAPTRENGLLWAELGGSPVLPPPLEFPAALLDDGADPASTEAMLLAELDAR
jgi:serine/threonine protein kinase/tetratricopeptide (TPR) repeat protein